MLFVRFINCNSESTGGNLPLLGVLDLLAPFAFGGGVSSTINCDKLIITYLVLLVVSILLFFVEDLSNQLLVSFFRPLDQSN